MSWTGGCQCGAVRYRVEGELGRASICHCRMCQKAFGAFFGPLVSARVSQITWTRGEPKRFQSSNRVARGFCADCGTPLTFEWSKDVIELSIGSFDRAAEIQPTIQMAVEQAVPCIGDIATLPTKTQAEEAVMQGYYATIVSNQHPDHDTDVWRPTT